MKKILLILSICFLTACSFGMNATPKEKVKALLDKYKNQDQMILDSLDDVIEGEYTGEYNERFKSLIKRQYDSLEYEITNEYIDGEEAVVSANIIVYDYSGEIDKINTYISEHPEEFYKDDDESEPKLLDDDKVMKYKFNILEGTVDRKTYKIDFNLQKENNEWVLEELPNSTIQKIHGMYNY